MFVPLFYKPNRYTLCVGCEKVSLRAPLYMEVGDPQVGEVTRLSGVKN